MAEVGTQPELENLFRNSYTASFLNWSILSGLLSQHDLSYNSTFREAEFAKNLLMTEDLQKSYRVGSYGNEELSYFPEADNVIVVVKFYDDALMRYLHFKNEMSRTKVHKEWELKYQQAELALYDAQRALDELKESEPSSDFEDFCSFTNGFVDYDPDEYDYDYDEYVDVDED